MKILIFYSDFQRNFVWDSQQKKSRLIESIIRIPLPMFYFAEDEEKEGLLLLMDFKG
jgi:uncharacterized protein with ParB-like and HNH nuclease domain